MKMAWLAALWLSAAVPAAAQIDLESSPEMFPEKHEGRTDAAPEPVAQALDLAFGATVWAQVRVSTNGPVADLTGLVRAGFYKLELIEIVLMGAQKGRSLALVADQRRKGAKLSAIAKDYGLDYDRIHEAALAIQETVDKEYLPRFPERTPRRRRPTWKDYDSP
jgi:hypothetical protein